MSQRKRQKQSDEAKDEEERQYGSLNDLDEKYPNRPHNHSVTFLFSELFQNLFDPLNENKAQPKRTAAAARAQGRGSSKLSVHEQRRHIIERFMARWRHEVGDDFYPAMRLILPDKDRDRTVYGLKENTIGKLLVKLMKIDKNSEDGYNLLHWKLPGTMPSRMAGDFAGRCYEVLAKRPLRMEVGDMRIGEVNELLDQLSEASGEAQQLPIFEIFYQRMNAQELQWLVRIILKQMKVGATERTFLDLWHPDGEQLFSVSSSLRRVCWELYDPEVRLEQDDAGIALMSCFQPQLAQFQIAVSFQKLVGYLGMTEQNKEFWIEEKLDGERMQMHMVEDETVPGGRKFAFWSRKAKEYTFLYGDGLENQEAALTPFLKDAFAPGVRNLILDGEMITWDPVLQKMVAFGTLKTAANATKMNPHDETVERPLFRVFDILYLNDKDLTRYELKDRFGALQKAIVPVPGRLEILGHETATDPDDIDRMLRKIVAESSEGLVLKNPRTVYRLNSRNNDWIKVKPEYMTEFGESLDLVVIGGYYGSGRRGGILSSFLCGLRVSENAIKAGANPEKCLSFCKVGGGMKATDYAEIRHHTDGKWIKWVRSKPPSEFIELGGGERFQYEQPDEWIRPKDSVVISVKAASVASSDQFAAKLTLRFPRFRQLRLDKSWDSALTFDEFLVLRQRIDEEAKEKKEMTMEDRRNRRPTKRARKELVIAGQDSMDVEYETQTKTQVFDGLTFCVLSESVKPIKKSKGELEALVKANGGRVVQQPQSADGSTIVVADKKVVKVASLIKAGDVSIVRPKWLLDCVAQASHAPRGEPPASSLLPYEVNHLFHVTKKMEEMAKSNTDEFGDSYARDVDVDELREILAAMPKLQQEKGEDVAMGDDDDSGSAFDKESFLAELEERGRDVGRLRSLIFRRCRVHVVSTEPATGSISLLKLRNYLRFGGAVLVDALKEKDGVTHVLVVGEDGTADGGAAARELAADVRKDISKWRKVPRLVTPEWVRDCWKEGTLLDEEAYVPR